MLRSVYLRRFDVAPSDRSPTEVAGAEIDASLAETLEPVRAAAGSVPAGGRHHADAAYDRVPR